MRDQFTSDGIVLDNALSFWVHRVYQATRNEFYALMKTHGVELTPEQWTVLVRLWERDGRTQSELCEETFRDKPTMSRMIDGLETRGLVRRRSSSTDARARLVFLTREAHDLKPKLIPSVRTLVGRMNEGISDEDLVVTRTTLQRIFANLER